MNFTTSPSDTITSIQNNSMNRFNFEMCARDFGSLFYHDQNPDYSAKYPLIVSSFTTQSSLDTSIQTISIIIASFIALLSMLYTLFSRYLYPRGLTLHFIGIRCPEQHNKSQYKLLKEFQTDSTMISIQTPLKPSNTIQDLKQFIQNTYSLKNKDILISYNYHIISKYHEHDTTSLEEFGISDNSVLTLAISSTPVVPEHNYNGIHREIFERPPDFESVAEPVKSVNALFDMFQDEEDDSDAEYDIPEPKEEKHEPEVCKNSNIQNSMLS